MSHRRIALAWRPDAVLADCAGTDLVLARVGPERCPDDTPILGSRALAESGGVAVRLKADGLELETVAQRRGRWPWAMP
jgi:hypothetical protein